MVIGHFVKN